MRRLALPFLATALLLLTAPPPGAGGAATRTLEGKYRSGFGSGPVSATFVPTDSRLWEVRFDFRFNGRRHTYRGSAEGGFDEEGLAGRVQNENGRRTFTFRGDYADGVFRGTHAEIVRGRERPTGTLVLKG